MTSITKLNEFQYKMLADIDEDMAGFINLIQSDNSSKGLNWAGISGYRCFKGRGFIWRWRIGYVSF